MLSSTQQRTQDLQKWLSSYFNNTALPLQPLKNDASFRRYFRIHTPHPYIAVDAPPHIEDSHSFVTIAETFKQLGLKTPDIIAVDLSQGFMLVTDLGDDLYFHVLTPENADTLYKQAIEKLFVLQSCPQNSLLNNFTHQHFMHELRQFQEWYLLKHLKLSLSTQEETLLDHLFSQLINSALEQPQVCTHRDYHSRNLLVLPNNDVGILDFQDAVWGPVTYDLVSLIKDCYIAWPEEQVYTWAKWYYNKAIAMKRLVSVSEQTFLRWFDWMGLQRHLKAIYIFARKFHRDANDIYLAEIPRTLQYVLTITQKYPEFKEFAQFLKPISDTT